MDNFRGKIQSHCHRYDPGAKIMNHVSCTFFFKPQKIDHFDNGIFSLFMLFHHHPSTDSCTCEIFPLTFQDCFMGTGTIIRFYLCQWSRLEKCGFLFYYIFPDLSGASVVWSLILIICVHDIKNNAWVTVNNDFWVTSEAICQWFSRVTKSRVKIIGKSHHEWPKNRYSR